METPRNLQIRADAVVEGHKQAFERGLNPESVLTLRYQNPWSFEDFLLLQLGLKPASVLLTNVAFTYLDGKNYLDCFKAVRESGVSVNFSPYDPSIFWNPQLTRKVLRENEDLFEKAKQDVPDLMYWDATPEMDEFSYLLGFISSPQSPLSSTIMAGVLHGFPRRASEAFAEHYRNITPAIAWTIQKAMNQGQEFDLSQTIGVRTLCTDPEFRDRITSMARLFGHPNERLIQYMAKIRYADIPGTPYVTSGNINRGAEMELKKAFQTSKVALKLDRLLAKSLT
jgi:hypothetical protein